jgi:hypothetical protein
MNGRLLGLAATLALAFGNLLVACDVDGMAGPPLVGDVRERITGGVRICLQSDVVVHAGQILLASRPPNRGARGQGHRHPLITTGHIRLSTVGPEGCADARVIDGDVQVGDQLY